MSVLIKDDLHQFSAYKESINLSFHQYLLLSEKPILFHTGDIEQARVLIPQLQAVLGNKGLAYIFVSHFEADECGGLLTILNHFPRAITICPETTGRQFHGFGFKVETLVKKPGETLKTPAYELEFISYPSEMHLWEGLLVMERKRGIFFSSDLMIRHGDAAGKVLDSHWQTEINKIGPEQIPNPKGLKQLQHLLERLNPSFVATGHGPCLNLT
jgi:flavorubredoxin